MDYQRRKSQHLWGDQVPEISLTVFLLGGDVGDGRTMQDSVRQILQCTPSGFS